MGEEGGPARKAHSYFPGNILCVSRTQTGVFLEKEKGSSSSKCVRVIFIWLSSGIEL